MKNWSDAKVAFICLCVIALVIIIGLFIVRLVTKVQMSDESAKIMGGILTLTIGGIITFAAVLANKNKENDKL
jgi:ABC-type Fe3+-siderophore transport system permease subunit